MQSAEFYQRVANYGPGLPPETARLASLVTLRTLAEYLPAKEIENLSSQMPEDLAEAVTVGMESPDESEREVSLQTFYQRIAERAELPLADAEDYAEAVVHALKESIAQGEIDNIAKALSGELRTLITRRDH